MYLREEVEGVQEVTAEEEAQERKESKRQERREARREKKRKEREIKKQKAKETAEVEVSNSVKTSLTETLQANHVLEDVAEESEGLKTTKRRGKQLSQTTHPPTQLDMLRTS